MELLFGLLLQKTYSCRAARSLTLHLWNLAPPTCHPPTESVFNWSLFSMDSKTMSILLDSDDTGEQLLLAVHKGPRRSQRKKTGSDCETLEAFLCGKVAFASLSTGYRESVIKHHSAFTCDWCRPSRYKEPTRFSTLLKLAVSLIGLL